MSAIPTHVHSLSRRAFLQGSATLSAATATFGLPVMAELLEPQPTSIEPSSPATVSAELLQALGARIGREAAEKLEAEGHALRVEWLDPSLYTGTPEYALTALSRGLETGLGQGCEAAVTCERWTAIAKTPLLASARILDNEGRRQAVIEIDTSALSLLAMIEDASVPPSARTMAVLLAPADAMYRIELLGQVES